MLSDQQDIPTLAKCYMTHKNQVSQHLNSASFDALARSKHTSSGGWSPSMTLGRVHKHIWENVAESKAFLPLGYSICGFTLCLQALGFSLHVYSVSEGLC